MRVAIAGGGTGGHLFPGIAIAQELTARGHFVFFIGNRGAMEQKLVPGHGFEIEYVKGGQIKGKGLFGAVKGLLTTLRGVFGALGVIRRRRPDAVVGVGGYASVAGVFASWLLGKTSFVCEQNSVPGRANRLLAKFAKIIFTAFPSTEKWLPEKKIHLVGNPLRIDFREKLKAAKKDEESDKPSLFIFGGSQGARTLNNATVAAVKIWMEKGGAPFITHQVGSLDFEKVMKEYKAINAPVKAFEFINDMPGAYGSADLILSRAGAMSISEIAASGLPGILVPFPYAVDDHQTHNAMALVEAGGAILIHNHELTGERMVKEVDRLLADKEKLEDMAKKAKSFDKPGAAKSICDRIESMDRG